MLTYIHILYGPHLLIKKDTRFRRGPSPPLCRRCSSSFSDSISLMWLDSAQFPSVRHCPPNLLKAIQYPQLFLTICMWCAKWKPMRFLLLQYHTSQNWVNISKSPSSFHFRAEKFIAQGAHSLYPLVRIVKILLGEIGR